MHVRLRRLLAFVSALVLVAAVGVMTASSASAIGRASCVSTTDWYYSNQTTCWSGTGGTSVTLYSNTGHHSGSFAGCYAVTQTWFKFVQGVDFSYCCGAVYTVLYIYHSTNGQPTSTCGT